MDQPARVDRLEQKVSGLEAESKLASARNDVAQSKADEAQTTASAHTSDIAVLKAQVDFLMREREAAISRRWQIAIGILVGIVVGLVVGIILAGLGLKK